MNTRNAVLILTLVSMVMMTLASVAQGNDEWEREFDVEPGQKIELEMKYGGSLEVEGWDRDLVQIQCSEGANDLDDYEIEVDETRWGLIFSAQPQKGHHSNTGLKVRLMVPSEFDIKTISGGGGIRISGVSGEFRGKTGGGSIYLKNVSGKANLSSGGGIIKILDSELDGKVSTGGGGGLVRNVTGNVRATSGGGIVEYENVRDDQGDFRGPDNMPFAGVTSGTIIQTTAGGEINLNEAPEGAMVKTGGGNIRVRDAAQLVRAQTGGGDIEIEIKDGFVFARTGAGDMEVVVEGGLGDSRDGIDLSTGHGEITLIVPADASMEFDLDLRYTRSSGRDFAISSDFDMDIEHTRKWKKESGSNKWKHIYGTGSINGGDHRVIIRCVNGNINIIER